MNEIDAIDKLLAAWNQQQPLTSSARVAVAINQRKSEMKIEIERINNGWLVNVGTGPSAADPLAQRGVNGRHFADTPEAICGMIAEWVLEECKRQEG